MNNQIEAVIFDWAGTVVDFGSWAPTSIFVEALKKAYEFDITLAEARIPMGLGKRDHIKALGKLPTIKQRWLKQFNQPMADHHVDHIYRTFMPMQKAKVVDFSDIIPGTHDVVHSLRNAGIKIGSCSGYPREVMDVLVPSAAKMGYLPDCVVASDDLTVGARPGPWMALQNVIELGVQSVSCCIKVDDSAPGIQEGINAGMWTVGLSLSGNEAGMTLKEYQQASEEKKSIKRQQAIDKLISTGAHYVVDTIADFPRVLKDINHRVANGEKP